MEFERGDFNSGPLDIGIVLTIKYQQCGLKKRRTLPSQSSWYATHMASFDKKVHKPDVYWTLAVTRVKRANHDEKQEKYLYLGSIYFILPFLPQSSQFQLTSEKLGYLCIDFTFCLSKMQLYSKSLFFELDKRNLILAPALFQ